MTENETLREVLKGIAGLFRLANGFTPKPIDKTFAELNTSNAFVKAKANAFDIEKMLLSFVQFDKATKKLTASIDLYLSFSDSLVLANDILSGKLAKLAQQSRDEAQKTGNKYPNEIYKSRLGGVNEEKAKARNMRTDGMAVSRYFTISPGSKLPFIFTAFQQAGKSTDNGLITPVGKPEMTIRVGCDADLLKGFALLIQSHINGYIASQYSRNCYAKQFPQQQ